MQVVGEKPLSLAVLVAGARKQELKTGAAYGEVSLRLVGEERGDYSGEGRVVKMKDFGVLKLFDSVPSRTE
jgi:hypothetical protein